MKSWLLSSASSWLGTSAKQTCTTYRQLSDEQKQSLSESTAIPLLVEHPAMIKRPIIRIGDLLHIGFKAEQYRDIFHI